MTKNSRNKNELERIASKATRWIGSIESLIAHTILFAGAFMFILFGVPFATVLLFLTTIVSLEAIYLSIFIQMSVNKATKDIEYIQEDVEDIQEDVDEIQEDVAEIEKDVDEIQEDVEEDEKEELARDKALMDKIELTLESLMSEIKHIKDRQK